MYKKINARYKREKFLSTGRENAINCNGRIRKLLALLSGGQKIKLANDPVVNMDLRVKYTRRQSQCRPVSAFTFLFNNNVQNTNELRHILCISYIRNSILKVLYMFKNCSF